jgi:hypothetical protein
MDIAVGLSFLELLLLGAGVFFLVMSTLVSRDVMGVVRTSSPARSMILDLARRSEMGR